MEDLEQFIPKSHIITELGGLEQWEYKYQEPSPDEDAAMADKETVQKLQAERDQAVRQYEELTKVWLNEASEGAEAPSSATKTQRFEVAKTLRDGYWMMDKYIRGRTFYDRTGVIGPDGSTDFYRGAATKKETNDDDVD